MVTTEGKILNLIKGKTQNFDRYLLNFGTLGIITRMSMKIEKSYNVTKSIFSDLKWDTLFSKYDEIMSSSYNLALFVDYPKRTMR